MDKKIIIEALGADMHNAKDRLLVNLLNDVAGSDKEAVHKWLDIFKGEAKYRNFLTEEEAHEIVAKFQNADGTKGAKWSYAEIKNVIDRNNLKMEEEPYFNCYSMFVAINMFVSDQYKTLLKWAGNSESKMFELCYDLSYNQLKDIDKPHWVRTYFDV